MLIPVEMQYPNKPQTRRVIGMVPDFYTADEVARALDIPRDSMVDAKIIRRKGRMRWSVVSLVMKEAIQ